MRCLALGCWLAVAPLAQAGEIELVHQTRLLDAAGGPITGQHAVQVRLWDAPDAPQPVWTKTYPSVPFEDGYATLTLSVDDVGTALDGQLMQAPLTIELAVDGAVLGPRQPLASVPRAGHAETSAETRAVYATRAADEACARAGQTIFDTDAQRLMVCDDGGAWQTVTSAANNHVVHVESKGLSSDVGGRQVRVDGTPVLTTGRSYGLVAIRLADGQVTHARSYDV